MCTARAVGLAPVPFAMSFDVSVSVMDSAALHGSHGCSLYGMGMIPMDSEIYRASLVLSNADGGVYS